MEPLDSTNVRRFTEFMHKFANWLNEWMLSGKRGLSKHFQTSQSFLLLIQHLLETKGLDHILTGNIYADPLEKHFGRYRELRGANYFGSEKQFLDAEKSVRVKSLIKFSGYGIERGRQHNRE